MIPFLYVCYIFVFSLAQSDFEYCKSIKFETDRCEFQRTMQKLK